MNKLTAKGIVTSICVTMMFIAASTLSTSCQKDLYYPPLNTSVEMKFNWEGQLPDSSTRMRLYIYPETGSLYTQDITNYNGGMVNMPTGLHKVIAINAKDDDVDVVASTYETTYVTTNTTTVLAPMSLPYMGAAPRPAESVDEPVKQQAPLLYADTCSMLRVKAGENIIEMSPKSIVDTIDIMIKGITNIKYLEASSVAVSGLPMGYLLSKMEPMSECCTMVTGMDIANGNSLSGRLVVFGRPKKDDGKKIIMTLYTVLGDGSKYFFNYDVTEKVTMAEAGKSIVIEIEELTLPEPANNGGFNPQMGEWVEMSEEIMV